MISRTRRARSVELSGVPASASATSMALVTFSWSSSSRMSPSESSWPSSRTASAWAAWRISANGSFCSGLATAARLGRLGSPHAPGEGAPAPVGRHWRLPTAAWSECAISWSERATRDLGLSTTTGWPRFTETGIALSDGSV